MAFSVNVGVRMQDDVRLDFDQPAHLRSLIRVFGVCMKKPLFLG